MGTNIEEIKEAPKTSAGIDVALNVGNLFVNNDLFRRLHEQRTADTSGFDKYRLPSIDFEKEGRMFLDEHAPNNRQEQGTHPTESIDRKRTG